MSTEKIKENVIFPSHIPDSIKKQIQTTNQQVLSSIENGDIQIPINSSHLSDNRSVSEDDLISNKLKRFHSMKNQLQSKIKMIEIEEKEIRGLRKRMENKKNAPKIERSVLTEEDKNELRKIKQSQNRFESVMRNRVRQLMQKIKQREEQEQLERQFNNDIKRKQRVVKLSQKRARLAASRSKTVQILQNSQIGLKRDNYTYIKYAMKDQEQKKQKQKRLERAIREKRKKSKVDFSEIKKHQKNHQQYINEKKMEFLFEFKENQIKKRSKTINHQHSETIKKLFQEEKVHREQILKKSHLRYELRQKIKDFQLYLAQKFRPKVSDQSIFVPRKQIEVLNQLSFEERRKMGEQYLLQAKRKAKKISKEQLNQKLQTSSDYIGPPDQSSATQSSQKYPNYLGQLRKEREKQPNYLHKILKSKRITARKVEQVVRWMQKKQQRNKIGKKQSIKDCYQSAIEKIDLLNSLYEKQIS